VVPSGTVNADHIRTDEDAQSIVREALDVDKVLAMICHGPWLLVSAGVAKGRTLSSYPSLPAFVEAISAGTGRLRRSLPTRNRQATGGPSVASSAVFTSRKIHTTSEATSIMPVPNRNAVVAPLAKTWCWATVWIACIFSADGAG
jgi:putative intracellular protease/amidase